MEPSTWDTCHFFIGPHQIGHILALFTVQRVMGAARSSKVKSDNSIKIKIK